MGLLRSAVSGLLAAAVVKTAYGTLGSVRQTAAITCDELKSDNQTLANPTRYLARENCVDFDFPVGNPLKATVRAYTYKSPAPQVIGSASRMRVKCGSIITTAFSTAVVPAYNATSVTASGFGPYAPCMNHGNEFRTQHNHYQSNPYLSLVRYVTITGGLW